MDVSRSKFILLVSLFRAFHSCILPLADMAAPSWVYSRLDLPGSLSLPLAYTFRADGDIFFHTASVMKLLSIQRVNGILHHVYPVVTVTKLLLDNSSWQLNSKVDGVPSFPNLLCPVTTENGLSVTWGAINSWCLPATMFLTALPCCVSIYFKDDIPASLVALQAVQSYQTTWFGSTHFVCPMHCYKYHIVSLYRLHGFMRFKNCIYPYIVFRRQSSTHRHR